jgi:hypothetical protein
MFDQKDLEKSIEDEQRKINELIIRNENLDLETDTFLKNLKVTPEQLSLFMANKDNFTEENWERLQQEKEKREMKLETEIKNIRNPLKVKKTYSERKIENHWLFVR